MPKKLTTEEFKIKAIAKHGSEYDYDEVDYSTSHVPVWITHKSCGHRFKQAPNSHLNGRRCPKCFGNTEYTLEIFVEMSNNIFPNGMYGYQKFIFSGYSKKGIIHCNLCNKDFPKSPVKHLAGQGCPDCSKIASAKKRTKTTEQFLKDFELVEGNENVSMKKFIYNGNKVAGTVICNLCNYEYERSAGKLLAGFICCPSCGRSKNNEANYAIADLKSLRFSDEEKHQIFYEEVKKIYGDNAYNVSGFKFVNMETPSNIGCNTCGLIFKKSPSAFLRGQGCPACALTRRAENQKDSLDIFIEKAIKIHGNSRYGYHKFIYIDSSTPGTLVCNECGNDFEQRPNDHLCGKGCRKCSYKVISDKQKSNKEEFVVKSINVHGIGRYNLDNFIYTGSGNASEIKCNECGHIFEQTPDSHLYGCGCPRCVGGQVSKPESEMVDYIKTLGYDCVANRKLNCKDFRFDCIIHDLKIAFEFNGVWRHSTEFKVNNYHFEKRLHALENGYRQVIIWEDDWHKSRENQKELISNIVFGNESYDYQSDKVMIDLDYQSMDGYLNNGYVIVSIIPEMQKRGRHTVYNSGVATLVKMQ